MLKRVQLLASLIFGISGTVFAAAGREGASFLDIPVGAGPAALGGAYTALATDLYAPVWNPAGLGFLESTQLGGQHLSYLESIHYEHAGFVTHFKSGAGLGVSAQYLGSGDIPGANLAGANQPSYSSHFGAYSLAYGQALGQKVALGLTAKFIDAKISDVASHAYAGDLGALYKPNDHSTLAATLTNLGSKLKFLNDDSSLPVAGHLAAAYAPDPHWLASVEGVFPKSGPASAHVGLQWQPLELIAIRAGYRTDTINELSAMAGMTIGAGIKVWGQELAYAWVPYGDLGDTQYFSLVIRFGEESEKRKNLIRGQDIKRHREADRPESDEYRQLIEILKKGDEKTAQTPAGTLPQ